MSAVRKKQPGLFAGHDPALGSDQEGFKTPCGSSRVGQGGVGRSLTGRSRWVKRFSKYHGPGSCFPTRENRSGLGTREKPWKKRLRPYRSMRQT